VWDADLETCVFEVGRRNVGPWVFGTGRVLRCRCFPVKVEMKLAGPSNGICPTRLSTVTMEAVVANGARDLNRLRILRL
jgi:hypothetical protein